MRILYDWLYQIVAFFARVHDEVGAFNLALPEAFSDKELHFLVIGFFSLLMLIVLYPIFLFLVRHKCVAILTWLFAFIFVVFTCFSIEFGQYMTGTGSMELSDVTYGVMGFVAASCVALALLLFIKCLIAVIRLLRRRAARSRSGQPTDSGTDMT